MPPARGAGARRGITVGRIVLACLFVAVLAACGDVADTAAGGAADSDVVRSSATEPVAADSEEAIPPSPEPVAEEPEPEVTEPPAPAREDLVIGDTGFSVVPSEYDEATSYLTFAALVTNPNPDTHVATFVDVNVSFTDAAGTVVKTASEHIAALLPGQTVAVGDTLIDAPAEVTGMDVQVRADDWEEVDEPLGAFEVRDVTYTVGEFGATTTGTIASTFAEDIESPLVVAVYRDDAGAIVGGDFTFADFVPAGSDIGVEVSTLTAVPDVASAELYAQISGLSLWD